MDQDVPIFEAKVAAPRKFRGELDEFRGLLANDDASTEPLEALERQFGRDCLQLGAAGRLLMVGKIEAVLALEEAKAVFVGVPLPCRVACRAARIQVDLPTLGFFGPVRRTGGRGDGGLPRPVLITASLSQSAGETVNRAAAIPATVRLIECRRPRCSDHGRFAVRPMTGL